MIVAVLTLFSEVSRQGPWDSLIGVICVVICEQRAPKLLARVRSGGSGCTSLKSSRFHGFCLCFHRSSDPVKPKTPSWHVLQWPPLQYVSLLHGHPVTVVFFTLHGTTFTRSKDNIYIYWISVVWIVFKLFARVIKLIFRSNMIENKFKFHMPAEGRTRPGKSIYLAQTGKTHSCRRTWMWLQGGFEQSLLEKVGIFWPHGPWHRFKN